MTDAERGCRIARWRPKGSGATVHVFRHPNETDGAKMRQHMIASVRAVAERLDREVAGYMVVAWDFNEQSATDAHIHDRSTRRLHDLPDYIQRRAERLCARRAPLDPNKA